MPLFELLEQHSVWETLTTDPDAFQNTITPQLVKDEMGLDFASLQQRTEKHNQLNPLSAQQVMLSSWHTLILI